MEDHGALDGCRSENGGALPHDDDAKSTASEKTVEEEAEQRTAGSDDEANASAAATATAATAAAETRAAPCGEVAPAEMHRTFSATVARAAPRHRPGAVTTTLEPARRSQGYESFFLSLPYAPCARALPILACSALCRYTPRALDTHVVCVCRCSSCRRRSCVDGSRAPPARCDSRGAPPQLGFVSSGRFGLWRVPTHSRARVLMSS